MLNNRADKLVLKAFLELPVPEALRREDAALAARCGDELHSVANRLLVGRSGTIEIRTPQLISKEDKAALNAANAYTTYTSLGENMTGRVRFVWRTDANQK